MDLRGMAISLEQFVLAGEERLQVPVVRSRQPAARPQVGQHFPRFRPPRIRLGGGQDQPFRRPTPKSPVGLHRDIAEP